MKACLYIGNLIVQAISMIGNWLVCKVGNGEQVRVGIDSWIGSINAYIMPEILLEVIQDRVIYTLNHIVDEIPQTYGNKVGLRLM